MSALDTGSSCPVFARHSGDGAVSRSQVCRFRITLRDIEPPVWREIEVPATYSLWDLHVAIQDAMGWKDCHLHAFRFRDPTRLRP